MTAPTPNAELAYRILDHIDAHPEEWDQGVYIGKTDCGTVACFAGRAILLSLPEADVDFQSSGRRLPRGMVLQESGGVRDENGLLVSSRVMAERLLGVSSLVRECEEDEEDLFDQHNTREDLGRLVAEIFGPRPCPNCPPGHDCERGNYATEPVEMQPPPCADHEQNELNCPVCTAQRRAFYNALGRTMVEALTLPYADGEVAEIVDHGPVKPPYGTPEREAYDREHGGAS